MAKQGIIGDDLRESEALFRTIFSHIPVMIDAFDSNGKCVLWNQVCQRQLGYTQEEINAATNSMELFYPDLETRERVIKNLRNPKGQFVEYEVRSKCGQMRIQQWANFLINDHLVIGVGHDITEQRKQEKISQFIAEISRFSATEKSLYDFIKKLHAKFDEFLHVKNFYMALYNESTGLYTFPYHVDEYDDYDSLTEYDLTGSLTEYVRMNKRAELIDQEREEELFGKQENIFGQYSPIWMGAPLIGYQGDVIGVIAVQDYKNSKAYSDEDLVAIEVIASKIGLYIERIKHNEELHQAKERAMASDSLKSTFLANMSHEIRTPLNGIIGFAELLEDAEIEEDERQKYLRIIQTNGDRLLTIVNDLIDISRIESGQITLSLKDFAVNDLLKDAYSFFKKSAEEKGILLVNESAEMQSQLLHTDPDKLNQVLINLISNAVKYTEKGFVKFGFSVNDSHITFTVKDSGQGIRDELKPIIFERFSRDSLEPIYKQQGSGLGLGISKSLVEMMGGNLEFDSTFGEGSRFFFTIPLVKD